MWHAARLFTPFFFNRESFLKPCVSVFPASCPLRSFVRSRLGEGRIRSLLLVAGIIWIAAAQSARGAEKLIVELKEQSVVTSNNVLLKDISDLHGSDAVIENASQISLGSAPGVGVIVTLTRRQIIGLIQKSSAELPEIEFEGAEIVAIKRPGRPVQSDEISQVAIAYLLKNTAWKESQIEILSLERPKLIELPPGDARLQVSPDLPVTGKGKIIFPMELIQENSVLQRFWITMKIRIKAGVLTAARSIRPGKVIEPEDMVLAGAVLGDLHSTYLNAPGELIGKTSDRYFSPGDPLTREGFSEPLLIKRGDSVQLKLERSGLIITAQGRAEQDGRLGQTIRVRNLDFSTLVTGQVAGRAEVKVP
jgi:flagella basal body P-ring formation protein FlgA